MSFLALTDFQSIYSIRNSMITMTLAAIPKRISAILRLTPTAIHILVSHTIAIVESVIAQLVFVGGYHVVTHVAIHAITHVIDLVKQNIIINRIVLNVIDFGPRLRRLKEVLIAAQDK